MIDIENDVIDYVSKAIRAAHTGTDVQGEYVELPAKFPHVSIVQRSSSIVPSWRSCETVENAADVMFELNVYSNKVSGRKSEAKAIAATADEAFADLGIERTFMNQVPNLKDATIYRLVCRYEGRVIPNDDGKFYIATSR